MKTAILILVASIIGAAMVLGVHRYTSATTTVTPHDADVDASGAVTLGDVSAALGKVGALATGARPVAEQNLDANGNIKVHEQGTVNVNVISSEVPRLIPVAQDVVLPSGAFVTTEGGCGGGAPCFTAGPTALIGGFLDVRGCRHIDIFTDASSASEERNFNVELNLSPDGSNVYGVASTNGWVLSAGAYGQVDKSVTGATWGEAAPAKSPYVQLKGQALLVHYTNSGPVPPPPDVTLTGVWLYCS